MRSLLKAAISTAIAASSASSRCRVCDRDPGRMNSDRAECSHVECPNRRSAWSERPFQGYEATATFSDELAHLEPPAPKPEPLRRKSAKYRREKGMPR